MEWCVREWCVREWWSVVVCEGVVECSVEEGGVKWCVREWWSVVWWRGGWNGSGGVE